MNAPDAPHRPADDQVTAEWIDHEGRELADRSGPELAGRDRHAFASREGREFADRHGGEFASRDGREFAYVARPRARAPRAGVLVIHEGFGLNDHARDVCRRLAGQGYAALAPDLYWRGPARVAGYDEREQAIAMLKSLPDAQVLDDLARGLDLLQRETGGAAPVGVVGFRIGGRYALLLAGREPGRVACAVSYYGAGIDNGRISAHWTIDALGEASRIRAPLLLFFVGADQTVPADEVDRIERRLAEVGPPSEVVRYPGVRPGFCFEGRDTHAPREAADAWGRTTTFLAAHLHA